jgi:hypothetical protein
MTLPSRKTLAANALCLLALAWLYGGDLTDALRARGAEVSALLALPPLLWPAVVLGATAITLAVGAWGLWRGRGEGFKGYRLLPILLVCALFVDLVLAEGQMPLRPEDVALLSLQRFRLQAQALASGRTVPSEPARHQPLLQELGQPPYLVRGTRLQAWALQVRQDCEGPIREAPGVQAGTFLYCVARDRTVAWVTLVGLPAGERFGPPSVLSLEGEPVVEQVQPPLPEEEIPPPQEEASSAQPPPSAAGLPGPGPVTPASGP